MDKTFFQISIPVSERNRTIHTQLAFAIFLTGLMLAFGCTQNNVDKQPVAHNIVVSDTVFASPMDSLEWILSNADLPLNLRLNACDNLAYSLVYVDVNKARSYAQKGLIWSEEIKNDSMTAAFYRDLGMAYQVKNNYDSAQFCYEQSLSLVIRHGYEHLESFLYLAFGLMYSEMSQYEKSADYYEKALRLCEKLGLQLRYNTIILNIGITYLKMKNHERAESYFLQAKDIFLKNPYPEGLAHIYLNMGIMYFEQNKIEEAREAFKECLAIFQSIGNKSGESLALMNQSRLYAIDKKYDQALEIALKSLRLAEESGFQYVIKNALNELSNLYYDVGNFRLSEDYAVKEMSFIDSTETTERMILYKKLIPIYIKQRNEENALNSLAIYDSLMMVVNNAKVQSTYSEMAIRYETEKKELKIAALEEERRLMIWLGIAGGAVLFLSLVSFFSLWRWTVQKKRLADQQVKQLEQEKQLVATQSILDGETSERARLARDLHDGLGSLLTGAKLRLLEMKQGVKLEYADVERFDKALELLDDSVSEMRRVAHHLMPDSLSRFGLKPAVSDYCANLPSVKFAYYGDESRLEPKLEVMIYRSIYELVNNALKHAGAQHIIVQIMQEPDRIAFTVQDDGCGFDPSSVAQGMGLQNIRTRVASHNGVINIDSRIGEGTEINVELRIANSTIP